MDRRQRKTREAIFDAFTRLLAHKDFAQITVGQIIEQADVGRATFYAHFETKDYLLKEFCEDLFCHIFDAMGEKNTEHRHIFRCDAPDSVFLHRKNRPGGTVFCMGCSFYSNILSEGRAFRFSSARLPAIRL